MLRKELLYGKQKTIRSTCGNHLFRRRNNRTAWSCTDLFTKPVSNISVKNSLKNNSRRITNLGIGGFMNTRILKTLSVCAVLLFCATSFAFAAVECTIDLTSCSDWDQNDPQTWIENSSTHQLTINCKDGGTAVEGYIADFNISLQKVSPPPQSIYTPIATLTTRSTPTDSYGNGYITVPLIHVPIDDGGYIHICPFDDIKCTGGENTSFSLAALAKKLLGRPLISVAGAPGCMGPVAGCCETTLTVTCCTPNRVFTYCTTTPEVSCPVGTTHPDGCTTIFTQYAPGGICSYCTGKCDISTLITLSSFTAKASNGRVKLEWSTESEIENAGFNIYRSETEVGGYEKINTELITAKGSETKGAKYVFIDNIAKNRKTYFYKLEDIDLNGTSTMHGPKSATPRLIFGILGK